MLKQRQEQIQIFVRLANLIICVVAFFAAYWLRNTLLSHQWGEIGPVQSLSWLLAVSITVHLILYPALGFYGSLRLKTIPDIISMVFKAAVIEFFILGSLIFILKEKETSRYFFGLFLFLNYSLVLIETLGARVLLSSIRRRGYNYRQVLIVGAGESAQRVISTFQKHKHWGYIPCGLISYQEPSLRGQKIASVEVLGDLPDIQKIVKEKTIDEIYFALEHFDVSEISEQVLLCEKLGIPARFSMGLFDLKHSQVTFTAIDGIPILTFYTTLMTPTHALIKRIMDLFIAVIGLLITAALSPWIIWKIKKDSPGPVIFKQVRIGQNGRRFKCYKFRTMDMNAESLKESLLQKNQMEGPIFKIDHDPRIFKFGQFLRRTSLDELPQFFNILRGDMSVVGTRPPTPDEVTQYETHYRRRLSIKPGLTGLWQVSGRNSVKRFEEILALDLKYIDHWSLWLDIQIILKTIWVTLFRRGAY